MNAQPYRGDDQRGGESKAREQAGGPPSAHGCSLFNGGLRKTSGNPADRFRFLRVDNPSLKIFQQIHLSSAVRTRVNMLLILAAQREALMQRFERKAIGTRA